MDRSSSDGSSSYLQIFISSSSTLILRLPHLLKISATSFNHSCNPLRSWSIASIPADGGSSSASVASRFLFPDIDFDAGLWSGCCESAAVGM